MDASALQILAAALFGVAILHTCATKFFEHLAHTRPAHAGLWHLLGEVEVVFGFWAMILMIAMFALDGSKAALQYIEGRSFIEPMFVFAIMVIAGTRPILNTVKAAIESLAIRLPFQGGIGVYFLTLALTPLLGSFITEPAAMTLAALMIRDQFFRRGVSTRLKYATLGVLFVNISIGGALTPFAAPPVLIVASPWNWDVAFMLSNFGWRAAVAVSINTLSAPFKYALVAGAVTGGGLTIIANAPNPAGVTILKEHFQDQAVHPLGLFMAALGPTIVADLTFLLL